ncbi:MAG: cation transporter dimerization domain-containing protein [Deltaproteobacteria bacterium]|jgi:divalent metal cation (Fe/Co/Zn/Cd) transporter
MVVTVDSGLSTAEAHAITDAIEEQLRTQLSVEDVTIHVEPES